MRHVSGKLVQIHVFLNMVQVRQFGASICRFTTAKPHNASSIDISSPGDKVLGYAHLLYSIFCVACEGQV